MNSSIIIKEVISEKDLKDFVQFPFSLYKNHPYWVGPIIKEELETLNKKKNPVFQNAIANYFLAYKNGLIVGRIAVIINWIEVNEIKKSKVRFGWFDFIDDINVSKKLLEKVENRSVYLEEYTRGKIGEEEQHSLELKAMLKDFG